MKEAKDSFLKSFGERFNSTLFITFLFYFIVFNWKAIVYLFSPDLIPDEFLRVEGNAITRLDYIQNIFTKAKSLWWILGFTIGSLLLFPLSNWLVSYYKTLIRIKRDNVNKRISLDKSLRTPEEYRDLYEKYDAQTQKYDKAILRYDKILLEEVELKEENKEFFEKVKVLESQIEKHLSSIQDSNLEVGRLNSIVIKEQDASLELKNHYITFDDVLLMLDNLISNAIGTGEWVASGEIPIKQIVANNDRVIIQLKNIKSTIGALQPTQGTILLNPKSNEFET
jgi:hypothetical protein